MLEDCFFHSRFPFQDAFYKISRQEGVKSLWSGLSPTLVLAIPATVIYFVCYEETRLTYKDLYIKHFSGWFNHPQSFRRITIEFHVISNISDAQEQHFIIPLLAGMSARVMSVSFVSPLELIRTKMQSQKLSYFGELIE